MGQALGNMYTLLSSAAVGTVRVFVDDGQTGTQRWMHLEAGENDVPVCGFPEHVRGTFDGSRQKRLFATSAVRQLNFMGTSSSSSSRSHIAQAGDACDDRWAQCHHERD